ncbi:MAG TPA: hypothetical protein VI796_02560 [Candidatus Thermoplasmatota archaeon]|nr:hypothetical protein [Candidatus Thermoplasmatota archaeon]
MAGPPAVNPGVLRSSNPFDLPPSTPAPVTAAPPRRIINESQYRLSRNLVLLLAINAVTVTLLVHAHWPGRVTIVTTVVAVAALLTLNSVLAFKNGDRAVPWLLLMGSIVLSRSLLTIGSGNLFGVRDSAYHIFTVTWGILSDGHVPPDSQYAQYPLHHILLASTKLLSGMDVWVTANVLAIALAVLTAVFILLVARIWFPGSEYLAGVAFLAFPPAVSIGFLYQPLTLSMALFAGMAYLLIRRSPFPLGRTLFLTLSVALTFTHPYSAAILGMACLLAAGGDSILNRRVGYLPVAFLGATFTFAYSTFIGEDYDYFLSLFQYRFGTPEAQREFAAGPNPISPFRSSWFFRIWNYSGNLAILVPAIVGWVMLLAKRKWRPAPIHWLATTLAVVYLFGLFFAFLLPYRTLALAAVVITPFAGWALYKAPRWVVGVSLPLILVVALTAVDVTSHYFPWDEGNLMPHPLENQAATLGAMGLVSELETGLLHPGPVISSHPLFYQEKAIQSRAFSGDNRADGPNATYFVYRTDSAEYGYSNVPFPHDSDFVISSYRPFPTKEQLELLDAIQRVGEFGSYQVYRV